MSIGDQFKGLDMSNLIGGPLTAAAESSVMLAKSTAEFINAVGFDSESKTRNVFFKFHRSTPDPDGNISKQEMGVEVPLLAIVPIPNLQIDEVNIMFDMEVKQSSRNETGGSVSSSMSGRVGFGPFKVSIEGSVSAHHNNTRSSDNSAKYHVDVRATNHGIPEGLARVMDMMAANVAPSLISSKPVDQSGNELTGQRKERNLELKRLREERFQLESSENAARKTYEIKLDDLIKQSESICNDTKIKLLAEINNTEDEARKDALTAKAEAYNRNWDDLKSNIKDIMVTVATSSEEKKLTDLRPPANDEKGIPDVSPLNTPFDEAVDAYGKWEQSNNALQENELQYNKVMRGNGASKPALT